MAWYGGTYSRNPTIPYHSGVTPPHTEYIPYGGMVVPLPPYHTYYLFITRTRLPSRDTYAHDGVSPSKKHLDAYHTLLCTHVFIAMYLRK
jgi:hypothetical protein